MENEMIQKMIINNENNYSDILPTAETVAYLVNYCDKVYKDFVSLLEEDEKKNEQYKLEYKNYMYKKSYADRFEVTIRNKNYNNITCKSYDMFLSAIEDGNVKNVQSITINLELGFKRGKERDFEEHENEFKIEFKPFDTTFVRKSNHNDPSMNNIEEKIKMILERFPTMNTIFYTKESK